MDNGIALITLSGECFEVAFGGTEHAGNRDGVLYLFRLEDLKSKRGTRLVSIFRSGQIKLWRKDYDLRIANVRLNAIRRAFDSGTLSFDVPFNEHTYTEIVLQSSEFDSPSPASVEEIKRFIKHTAYWAFKLNPRPDRFHVAFDIPIDLEYLGVSAADVNRYVAFLSDDGFILSENVAGRGRATSTLIKEYEAETDHQTFQRMAIEESKKSILESEDKPKVGVVVVKNGRVLAKAHRGEHPKCHAEYIALEKKLQNETLVGVTVYTTLEPCTTRNHPKVPCAQRLIEHKVKSVFIGMLDPNPAITGRGQMLLSEANIETQLFDHELAAQAQEINREFIRHQKQKQTNSRNAPHDLTLHDLFLRDFDSVQQKSTGAILVDDANSISVQYLIAVEPAQRSKFLVFYIPHHGQTAAICAYLANQYEFVLDKAPQLLVEQKKVGDSSTTSTSEAIFTNRIFIYHDTYLEAEKTVALTKLYKQKGVSVILRSSDYLSTKKLEIKSSSTVNLSHTIPPVAELHQNPFPEYLVKHVRQTVGYTMTHSGQLLLRWLLIQGRIECTQRFMPEISFDTQTTQLDLAVNAGIVRREQEQGGLMCTYYVVNPEHKPILEKVLAEVLAEGSRSL